MTIWRPKPVTAGASDGWGTVRLIAAFLVIVDHSMPLTGSKYGSVLPSWLGIDLGNTTVAAFMAMSGYLVTRSWQRDPSVVRFTARRLLRIMPGLVLAITLTVFLLGPLLTVAPDYFHNPDTWTYLTKNVQVFPQQYVLPGVFTDVPFPGAVNGSLWTLPIELLGYLLVIVLGLLGALRWRPLAVLTAAAAGTLFFLVATGTADLGKTVLLVVTTALFEYLTVFCVGVVMYLYRERIQFTWYGVAICACVELALNGEWPNALARMVTVPYLVFTIAERLPRRSWLPPSLTMASYGTYLYGFPTAQIVIQAGARSPLLVSLLAVPIAFGLGLLSWHLVEKPAMKLRRFLRHPRPVQPDAAVTQPISVVST
ncbi:MAG: acyltransferase [Kibdelosporangium sp.]